MIKMKQEDWTSGWLGKKLPQSLQKLRYFSFLSLPILCVCEPFIFISANTTRIRDFIVFFSLFWSVIKKKKRRLFCTKRHTLVTESALIRVGFILKKGKRKKNFFLVFRSVVRATEQLRGFTCSLICCNHRDESHKVPFFLSMETQYQNK